MPLTDRPDKVLAERYAVVRKIGTGGMATVYLARDLKHNRDVAVKVLQLEFSAALGRERFEREIEIVSQLQHPNILPLYDSGEIDGGLFYVMPFVEGMSLRDRLVREGQLPIDFVVKVVHEAALALEYAHSRGIIHRDIKPENILLSQNVAIVADFGIARALAEAGGERLTSTGLTIGTPLYMSPEQAGGRVVDGRSDLYSLACVAYELLTGETPFRGTSAQAIIAQHTMDPVPSLRTLRTTVPPSMQMVIERALEKSPADRYATVTEFADEFRDAVAGQRPAALPRKARRGGRRWPLIAGAIAAVAVVVLGFVFFRPQPATRVNDTPSLVVLPFEHLGPTDDQFIADGLTEEIVSRVSGVSGLTVISSASAQQYGPKPQRLRDVGRELGVNYVLMGSVRTDRRSSGSGAVRVIPHLVRVKDEQEVWSEPFNADLAPGELFEVQSSIAEGVAGALNVSLMLPEQVILQARPTDDLEAYEAYLRGNVYAQRRYEERPTRLAIESFRQAVTLDPAFAQAYAKLGEAQSLYYYFHDRSPQTLDAARTAVAQAWAIDSTLPEVRLARGYLSWWGELDPDRALAELSAVRREQPNNHEVLWIIGNVQRRNGAWVDAIQTLHRAFELNPRSTLYALDLATSNVALRRFDEAERLVTRALELAPDGTAAVLTKALIAWVARGDTVAARHVIAEARDRISVTEMLKFMIHRHPEFIVIPPPDIRDSLEALTSASPGFDPAEVLLAKAYSFSNRGDSAAGRAQYDSARIALEKRVANAPDEAELHSLLAVAYAGVGRRADAIREAELGVKMLPLSREALVGVITLKARLNVALRLGEYEKALDILEILLREPTVFSKAVSRVYPDFKPLRGMPRFQELVRGPENAY